VIRIAQRVCEPHVEFDVIRIKDMFNWIRTPATTHVHDVSKRLANARATSQQNTMFVTK
jgi:hypothetical protein